MKPASIDDLAELLRGDGPFEIVGAGSKRSLCLPLGPKPQLLDMTGISGIVEWTPADQVAVVRAGTPVAELQAELERHGQCLPLPDPGVLGAHLAGFPGTVGGLVSMNLPHGLFGQCGGPRDWVLGMTIVRPDGSVAKCGSKAVKNVPTRACQGFLRTGCFEVAAGLPT
jgi:glycolate oxidase FAD binding subunit